MEAVVTITDTTTGEVAKYAEPCWEPVSAYMWGDGNYSCDCNRGLFFERAKGNDPDLFEFDCGDGRFRVIARNEATGQVLYEDS